MKIRPHSFSFSLHSLLILFVGVGIVVFIGLGINLLVKMQQVHTAAADERMTNAQAEMRRALGQLSQNVEQLGLDFAAWDEVQQQLLTPTYYAYWREQRRQIGRAHV